MHYRRVILTSSNSTVASPVDIAVDPVNGFVFLEDLLLLLLLLRTEDVHLHTPALRIGTHFLLTLETIVFLFQLLSTVSKPFSSLSTSERVWGVITKRAI